MKKTAYRAQNTQWVNPTTRPVKLDVCLHACAEGDGQDARVTIVIPPHGTKMSQAEASEGGHVLDDAGCLLFTVLSAELDNGIHQKDDSGKIIGGLAPQLRVFRGEEPTIEPALQPEKLALEQARKIEKEKQLEAGEADRQRLLAQSVAREAEDTKMRADALRAKEEAERARAEAHAAQAELAAMRAKLAKTETEKDVAIGAAADANKAKAEVEEQLSKATTPSVPAPAPQPEASKPDSPKGGGKSFGKAGG